MQVREDVHDQRLAERIGTVVSTVEDRTDEVYPGGRVQVLLVIDELYASLYSRSKGPNPVWIKPSDLEKL